MRIIVTCLIAGLALATAACTSAPPDGDVSAAAETRLTTSELQELLTGKTVSFRDGTRAVYLADGRFEVRDRHGDVRQGTYVFRDNSVCAHTPERGERCGRYVRTGGGYVFVGVVTGDRAAVASIR